MPNLLGHGAQQDIKNQSFGFAGCLDFRIVFRSLYPFDGDFLFIHGIAHRRLSIE